MDEPIPLITVSTGGGDSDQAAPKFVVHPKAIDILTSINTPVAVITIAGLYRTGKSYVLNRLHGSNRGFAVGALVEPCTQGIYMWVVRQVPPGFEDLVHEKDTTIVLLDTEGLGSFTKSKTYDVKIFTLAVLLSSLFMYNSMGSIDEGALDRLALVAELSNAIKVQADSEAKNDALILAQFLPKFIWLVRDFGLKLEAEDGSPITSDQYLENVLKPLDGDSEKTRTRNHIRSSILQFFPDRKCFTLKRPVSDEKMLQRLDELKETDLRPQFLEQMTGLMRHVYGTVRTKHMYGRRLTGAQLAALATAYVQAMNAGTGVPVIRSAWDNVIASQAMSLFNRLAHQWDSDWAKNATPQYPLETEALENAHVVASDALLARWRAEDLGSGAAEYEAKLVMHMRKQWRDAQDANLAKSQRACEAVLDAIHGSCVALMNEQIAYERLQTELAMLLHDQYLQRSLGPAKHVALSAFLLKRSFEYSRTIQERHSQARDARMAEQMEKRIEAAEEDKKNVEKLLNDMRANFVKSREEVAQLAAENGKLLSVLTRFSDVMVEGDMTR